MELHEFLIARVSEDEAAARRLPESRWYVDDDGCLEQPIDEGPDGEDILPNHHNSWHLALDPARVLAECESKRRIVEMMRASYSENDVEYWALHDALQLLALPYASHPDYDENWRP
jgi:hypothetical protein